MSLINLIKKMDQKIFNQVDRLISDSNYQKVIDRINLLDESVARVVVRSLLIAIPVLPLVFVFVLFLFNSSLKDEIAIKSDIKNEIDHYFERESEIQNAAARVLSTSNIQTESDLLSKLKTALSLRNISTDKISLSDFVISNSAGITRSVANLTFKEMNISEFSLLTKEILQTERMKINGLDVSRDNNSKLLSGRMGVIHFGRAEKISEL